MKTLRLALVALLFAGALSSLASTGDIPRKGFSIKISFEQAILNPGLAAAMYAQLNEGFLSVEQPSYTCRVVYKAKLYYVTGSYEQWSTFFGNERKFVVEIKAFRKVNQR